MNAKLIICSLLLVLLFCAGCESVRYEERAQDLLPQEVKLGGSTDRAHDQHWFTFFDNNQLHQIVQEGIAESPNLNIAWNRLQEAQANLKGAESRLSPTLSMNAGVNRQKQRSLPLGFSGSFSGARQLPDTQRITIYNTSLAASYELDLWGRLSSRANAAELTVEANRYQYRSAVMSLAANITQTWLQLRATKARIQLLRAQLDALKDQLTSANQRLGSGLIQAYEVTRLDQRLNEAKGQLALAQLQYALAESQLAILLGKAPQNFDYEAEASLPEVGSPPATGLSAELLQRRPDVQAAFLRLKAGDERIAAAVADQLPKLRFSPSVLTNATELANLGEVILWALQAGISDTLFDAGLSESKVTAAKALSRQALYQYQQTVLEAYKDVADALSNLNKQRERIGYLKQQLKAAREGLHLAETAFLNSSASYDTYLDALIRVQQLEIMIVRARQQFLIYRVQLHRALAGRWPDKMETVIQRNKDQS